MELRQFDEFEAAVERRTEEEAGELAGGASGTPKCGQKRGQTLRQIAKPDRPA